MKYLLNLKEIVQSSEDETINEILDYSEGKSLWNPQRVTATEDLNIQILRSLKSHNHVAIQGPPGREKHIEWQS